MIKIIAHRGFSSHAPENTIPAFKKGLEFGIDFLEFDVHLHPEVGPVVIHDETVSRTTNGPFNKLIYELSLHELNNLDAGSWFGPEYAGTKIPTLKEVLYLPRQNAGLMIELKCGKSCPQEMANTVLNEIASCAQNPQFGPLLIGSFEIEILKEIKRKDRDQRVIGLGMDFSLLDSWTNLGIKNLALNKDILTPERVVELHNHGIEVWAFTVDDLETASKLIEMDVDGLITNNPAYIKQHLVEACLL